MTTRRTLRLTWALLMAAGGVACSDDAASSVPTSDDVAVEDTTASDGTGSADATPSEDVTAPDAAEDVSAEDVSVEDVPIADVSAADVSAADVSADASEDATLGDPCATDNGGCDPNATCAQDAGKAVCTCNDGYVGSGTECTYDGVIVRRIDDYEASGVLTFRPTDPTRFASMTIDTVKDGAPFSVTAAPSSDGIYYFPGVPEGSYVLRTQFAVTGTGPAAKSVVELQASSERVLDLGTHFSYRSDTTKLTKPTYVSVSGKLVDPWQVLSYDEEGNQVGVASDELSLVSRGAYLYSYLRADADDQEQQSPPKNGDTALSGWTFDLNATSLVGEARALDGALGDDLVLLHGVTTVMPETTPSDPWSRVEVTSVRSWLAKSGVTLADGGTLAVEGDFQTATPKSFVLDYDGTAFSAILSDLKGFITASYLTAGITFEGGAPTPKAGVFADLTSLTVFATNAYVNEQCNPDVCDEAACPNGCDSAQELRLPGDAKLTLSYVNPFSYGQELLGLVLSYSIRVSRLMVADTTNERVRGLVSVANTAAALNGKPIAPTLSLPKNVTVAGAATPFTEITTGVGVTPTIAWTAPSVGSVSQYLAFLTELDDLKDDAGKVISERRVVLRYRGSATSFVVPEGVLVPGRHYFVEVRAESAATFDPQAPTAYTVASDVASSVSGVFAPCGCHAAATCAIDAGVETCTCLDGWTGDGKTCTALPCTLNHGGCAEEATCTNDGDVAMCACPDGMVGDGTVCAPDPCLVDNGGCVAPYSCSSTDGAPICTCETVASAISLPPFDVYVLLDQSGSMSDLAPDGGSLWEVVTGGLASFVASADNALASVGLGYFGVPVSAPCPTNCAVDADCGSVGPCFSGLCMGCFGMDSCEPADYAIPDVAMQSLSTGAAAVAASLGLHTPTGATPTSAALQGALTYASSWAADNPTHVVGLVMLTDGLPTQCDTNVDSIAGIAWDAFVATPSVPTYIIGVGPALSDMTPVAQAGGTGGVTVLDTASPVAEQLFSALSGLRTSAAACSLGLGDAMFEASTSLLLKAEAGVLTTLTRYDTVDGCTSGEPGWYVLESSPTKAVLCPGTCDGVRTGTLGQLRLVTCPPG